MKILIIDELSIYIKGIEVGLTQLLPDIEIKGVSDITEVWENLDVHSFSIILLDGEMKNTSSLQLLNAISELYPTIPVIIMLHHKQKTRLNIFLRHHAAAIVLKESPINTMKEVINATLSGVICLPDSSMIIERYNKCDALSALTERQKEILELIAKGQSNKQISRQLDISAGTVKAHLESIFRRLNVNNRTQAAMFFLDSN